MTDAELITATYFQTWHIILYLFVVFVIMTVYYQWRWAKTCKHNIQVLVAQSGGGGDFFLAPKVGGEVSIKNPSSDSFRTWPINELATIEVPYPGVGFVPAFLQKTIRLAIMNEGDWEPMLNRSRHYEKVASPDVIDILNGIADEADDKTKARIKKFVGSLSTSPTREMIASPAVLGNLMHEKITQAIITVNKEMLDQIAGLMRKLNNVVSSKVFFVGIGVVVAMLAFIIYQVIPALSSIGDLGEIMGKLDTIIEALKSMGA